MGVGASPWERALARLRDALGADRVLEGAPAAAALRGRGLNPGSDPAPRYLLRPRTTEECRRAVAELAAVGASAWPIAALTTFWEPHRATIAVGIDTLGLRAPCRVDARERVGYFGAGIAIREADRLARAHGLCLLAYPDSDGGTSLGSLAAVGCTTGLGMGRVQPLDQVIGLTVVSRAGSVLRTGASWRLGHGGAAHGMPDATGLFLASQGEHGVITEVLLALAPAPYLAARWWAAPCGGADQLVGQLEGARRELDQGVVDSLRLETVAGGREAPRATEWFLRCWAADSPQVADDRCASAARRLGAGEARAWVESPAGRRGEPPDDDLRYSLPPGSHQQRTGTAGFLGIEVTVNWGDQLAPSLRILTDLFAALGDLGLGHRRLGIYPGPHVVAIGVQAMLSGGETTADAVREIMATAVEPLSALGAVPYRPGRLWRDVMVRRERDDPCAALVRRAAWSS
ncbi:FAD-binding oxidoreductase [bacterium]|nr:FAD-binding oxidoreductase [bacterium]